MRAESTHLAAESWAGLEDLRQWGGRLVDEWGILEDADKRLFGQQSRGTRISGPSWGSGSWHQGQAFGLKPLDECSSSEPWGQTLGSGLCVLTSQWNLCGASE